MKRICMAGIIIGLIAMMVVLINQNKKADETLEQVDKFFETYEIMIKEDETYGCNRWADNRNSDRSDSSHGSGCIAERQDEIAETEDVKLTVLTEMLVETPAPTTEPSLSAWDLFYTPWGSVFEEITPEQFKDYGEFRWHDWRYTWYSEKVLPGGGLDIPGRWSDTYFVRDENNYICVACTDLSYGSIGETPWGLGKVYDTGNAHNSIDIYVTW